MTTPIQQGFPDWGRRLSRVDEVYVATTIITGIGTAVRGPFPVAGVPALGVNLFGFTGRQRLSLNYFMDEAELVFLNGQEITVAASGAFQGHVPVLGPWVTVSLTGNVANAGSDLVVYSATAPASAIPLGQNELISQTNNAIAIGATETVESTRTWPGWAHWTCKAENQRMTFTLRMRDYVGGDSIIDLIDLLAGVSEKSHVVALGPGIPVVQVVNGSGAASTWDSYLVGVPHMTMG